MLEAMNQPWRKALADYIAIQAKPVEKFGHQPRLYELTRRVADGLDYDDDVVPRLGCMISAFSRVTALKIRNNWQPGITSFIRLSALPQFSLKSVFPRTRFRRCWR